MRLGIFLCLSLISFWSFAQIGDSTVAHFSYRWNTENVFTIHCADTVQNSTPNYLGEISFWGGVFLFAVSAPTGYYYEPRHIYYLGSPNLY